MTKPLAFGLFFLLIAVITLETGCGVKTDPVPYVRAYPERKPKADKEPAKDGAKDGEGTTKTEEEPSR